MSNKLKPGALQKVARDFIKGAMAKKTVRRFEPAENPKKYEKRFPTWGKLIRHLERRLRKRLIWKDAGSLFKKSQPYHVRRSLLILQKDVVRLIHEISDNVLKIARERTPNYRNKKEIEWLFYGIGNLVSNTTIIESFITGSDTFQNMLYVVKVSNFIMKSQKDKLIKQLEIYKRKFHQEADPIRELLFRKATARHFAMNKITKSKRGYTWKKALEDENAESKLIPEREFDNSYVELVNHFKVWRVRNKISSMTEEEIEKRFL